MFDQLDFKELKPVSIVGAGPGGVNHLSLRAWYILNHCDVVVYDKIIEDDIIGRLPDHIEKIYGGKRFGDKVSQSKRLDFICDQYQQTVDAGKNICRLKSGDALIFGRTFEEMEYLDEHNIEFELVPGITAGLAGASLAGIPLTIREKVRTVILTTISTVEDGDEEYLRIYDELEKENPVIIYMGNHHINDLTKYLFDRGIDKSTPIVALSRISFNDQVQVQSTLSEIAVELDHQKVKLPIVLIIGKYVHTFRKW